MKRGESVSAYALRLRYKYFFLHVVLIGMMGIFLFPLYWLFITTFKPLPTIFKIPFEWIPEKWTLENIITGWNFFPTVSFTRLYVNTIIVTSVAVAATMFTASLVAFGFARLSFPYKKVLFMILLATIMLPSQVTLVPNYIIFKHLRLLDTLAALYIGGFFGGGAFYIFLLRQFILDLPIELDESAKIDGASSFTIFWRIIFPLTKPALLTVFIFSFQDNYTDFFTPLVFINTITKYTVPVGINIFLDDAGAGNLGAVIAMTSLSVVPLIVLYFIAQKQFMQGISTTGLKG